MRIIIIDVKDIVYLCCIVTRREWQLFSTAAVNRLPTGYVLALSHLTNISDKQPRKVLIRDIDRPTLDSLTKGIGASRSITTYGTMKLGFVIFQFYI